MVQSCVSEREEVDDAIGARREGQTEGTLLKSQDCEAKTASTQKRERRQLNAAVLHQNTPLVGSIPPWEQYYNVLRGSFLLSWYQ